jgi:hypothetical protein
VRDILARLTEKAYRAILEDSQGIEFCPFCRALGYRKAHAPECIVVEAKRALGVSR